MSDSNDNPGDSPRPSYRRKGKIARLPFDLRTQVNIMLRDGETYQQISKFLEKNDRFGFSDNNFTNWVKGGHQDWLKEQERADDIRLRGEASAALIKELHGSKANLEDANSLILADHIHQVITDLDPRELKELLAEKPDKFFALAQSINASSGERTRRMEAELKLTKYQDLVKEAKARMEALLQPKGSGAVTKETIKRLQEELKLL